MKKLICIALSFALLAGCTPASNSETEQPTSNVQLKAGTYTGVSNGRNGEVKVEVTVDETSIQDIKVVEHQETYGVGYGMETTPVEAVPNFVLENQSVNIDNIAGATISTNAVKNSIKDALKQAGATENDFNQTVEKSELESEYTSDVIVIGGGVAGLSAAISAKDNGANVILLEKVGITGGSTTVSGGKILAAGTQLQKDQGIEDSADALYEYMMSLNNGGDSEHARFLADNSAKAVEFMMENGVEFQDVERTHISIPTWRVHNDLGSGWMLNGKGGEMIVNMTDSAINKGVEIFYNTPAVELIVKDGKVSGVKATNNGKDIIFNANKGVIIATGGYGNNKELMAQANAKVGIADGAPTSAAVGTTGDGALMAQAIGAQVDATVGAQYTYVNFQTGVGIGEEAGLFLTEDGKRVCNEYSYQYHLTKAMIANGSSSAWYIADADDPNQGVQYAMTLEDTLKADSVEELAKLMEVDPTVLTETINRYNENCRNGVDADFGKPAEFLNELTGTLYAIKLNSSTSLTYGGIKTDLNAQVLDTNDQPIEGLYAAGEVAFYSLLGTDLTKIDYPSCGTAILLGTVFGNVAGVNAANR